MIWYLLIGVLIFFINILGHRFDKKVLCLIITLFILVMFIGLRIEVGGDWVAYQKAFNSGPFLSMGILYYGGFTWLAKFLEIGLIGLNFLVALVLCAGFLLIASELKNPSYFIVSTYFLFIAIVGLGFTRQTLSIGFLMISYFLYRKELGIYSAISFALAVSAHEAAIVWLPLIIRFSQGKSRVHAQSMMWIAAIGVAVGLFIIVSSWDWISYIFIDHYGYMPYTLASGSTMRALIYVSFSILLLRQCFGFSEISLSKEAVNERLILSVLIGLIILGGFVSSVISDRLLLFFVPFLLFFVLERSWMTEYSRVFNIGVALLCLGYFCLWAFSSPYAHFWFPYNNVLFL